MAVSGENLINKSFNVRISFSENGEPVIGAVLGFFTVDSDCYDIKPVGESTILAIAKALGIKKSSKSMAMNRKARGRKASPLQSQLDFSSMNSGS